MTKNGARIEVVVTWGGNSGKRWIRKRGKSALFFSIEKGERRKREKERRGREGKGWGERH